MKKSQITIFIILGIFLMLVILIYFFINLSSHNKTNTIINPIQTYIESCIQETATDALIKVGKNGGYIVLPNLSTKTNNPYYLFDHKNFMPGKKVIEGQLSYYVKNNLNNCLNDFKDFPDFTFDKGEINSSTNIRENYTMFYVDYPLYFHKGDKTYELKYFESKVFVRLGVIYNILEKFMQEQMIENNEVCISCLHTLALDNTLYFELKDYDDKTILFTVIDEKSKLREKEYTFIFANNYNLKENEIV